MTDHFGGVAIDEPATDQFGGVAVQDQATQGPTPGAGALPASFQAGIDYGQRMAMPPEELSQRIQAASPALEKGVALAKTPSPEWLQPAEKFMRTPLVSPEAINSLFQPVIPASVAADPVAQGIGQGASEAASQFTSPGNLALLPLIPEGAMGRVVAGGFTAQGLAQYPDLYRRFQATDDPKEKARILATAAVLVAPAAGLLPRGRIARTTVEKPPSSDQVASTDISQAPPQPNIPEGYARFQQPVDVVSKPSIEPATQERQPPVEQQSPQALAESGLSQPEPTQTVAGAQESLADIGKMGQGITSNLHEMLFNKLQKGDLTEAGMPSSVLREAYPEFQAGNIKTPEDLQRFVNQTKEVTENATQKRNQPESREQQYTGNAPGGAPAETGGRGGAQPEAPIAEAGPITTTESTAVRSGQRPATPTPSEAPPEGISSLPRDISPEPVGVTHEAIDVERESRGLDPMEKQASRALSESWSNAEAKTVSDPSAPRRLAEQLDRKPRALKDEDVAMLLRRRIETRTEFDNAVRDVNESTGDPQALAEAKNRLEQARTDYDQTQRAIKNSSSETGRGLRALQQMALEDYSLVKMEARRRAANGGKPLTDRQLAETKALHDKIAELQSKLDINEQVRQQADLEAEFKKLMRESRKGARESAKSGNKVTSYLDDQAAKARARIVERRGKLHAGYDPTAILDEAIIGASHIARGVTGFAQWSKVMLRDVGEHIRPYLEDLFKRARALHADHAKAFQDRQEAMLKRYKAGLIIRTEAIREKLAAGDLTKATRNRTKLDTEAFNLRGAYQRAKTEFDTAVRRDELAQRTPARKLIDLAVKAERSMKLTGITTLGKLGGAGVTRLVTTPLERVLQTISRAVPGLRQIAAAAPTERGLSFRGEAAAVRGIGTGIKAMPSIAKGIPTAHDVLYGKASYPVGSKLETILDIPQNIHAAIKSPFKESQRARVEVGLQKWAKNRGMDTSDPQVQQQLGELADQSAKRAIFMQDNFISDWWRSGIRSLEQSKKAPTAGYVTAKIGQFLLPIVKVPTNIAFEAATHMVGLGTGTAKLVGVMSRGLKNVKPEEADFIMRHYAKGMIGAGLFLTGYFNAKNIGGFYAEHDKRAPSDVGWGAARISGVNVPAWLLHAPAFIVLQAGATVYRMEHKMEKGAQKGKVAGTIAAAKGLADEIPFVREMGFLDNVLADGYEGRKARGNFAASTLVPQGVKNIAQWTDPLQEPRYRTPKSEADYIKMAIPGLREEVQPKR